MLKVDFHFHTIKIKAGEAETRNINEEEISKYIKLYKENNFNIIAITNHNYFNIEQYNNFKIQFEQNEIQLWPGIELDYKLENNKYHLNLICNPKKLIEFNNFFNKIILNPKNYIIDDLTEFLIEMNKKIEYKDFFIIFDWKNYRTINKTDFQELFEKIKNNIVYCIETSSIHSKHYLLNEMGLFSLCGSDQHSFEDFKNNKIKRIKEISDKYQINIDEDNFADIREKIRNRFFQKSTDISDSTFTINYSNDDNLEKELILKEGVNLILGDTGTGKTRILNEIEDQLNFTNQNNQYTYYDGFSSSVAANRKIKNLFEKLKEESNAKYNKQLSIGFKKLMEFKQDFNNAMINDPYIYWKKENENHKQKLVMIIKDREKDGILQTDIKEIIFPNFFQFQNNVSNLNKKLMLNNIEIFEVNQILEMYKIKIRNLLNNHLTNNFCYFAENEWQNVIKQKTSETISDSIGFTSYFNNYKNPYNEIKNFIKIFTDKNDEKINFISELSESKKDIYLKYNYSLTKEKINNKKNKKLKVINTLPIMETPNKRKTTDSLSLNKDLETIIKNEKINSTYKSLKKNNDFLLSVNFKNFVNNNLFLQCDRNKYAFVWNLSLFSGNNDNEIEYLSNGENSIYQIKTNIISEEKFALIDELEKNFSTKSLLKFEKDIRNSRNKIFIITTHNPSVWSSFEIRTITIKKYNVEKQNYDLEFYDLEKEYVRKEDTKDFVLDVLEGGDEVFDERRRIYGK